MGFLGGLMGDAASGDNHKSPVGAIGGKFQKWTDPIAWIPGVGDKWVDLTSNKIPEMSNKALSKVMQPFEKIDKTINPLRQIPAVDNVGNWIANKPASSIGMVAGAIAGGGALASGMGSGASGTGMGAATSGGTSGLSGVTALPHVGTAGEAFGTMGTMSGAASTGGASASPGFLSNFFGGSSASTPSLSGVTATPNVGGAGDVLGSSIPNVSSSFSLPAQGTDYMQLMNQFGNMQGGQQGQQQQGRNSSMSDYDRFLREDQQRRQLAEALRLQQFNQQEQARMAQMSQIG